LQLFSHWHKLKLGIVLFALDLQRSQKAGLHLVDMLSEAKVSLDYEKSTVFGLEVVGTLVEDQAILDVFL